MRPLSGETGRNWKQESLDDFYTEKWSRDIPVRRWNAAYSIGTLHCGKNMIKNTQIKCTRNVICSFKITWSYKRNSLNLMCSRQYGCYLINVIYVYHECVSVKLFREKTPCSLVDKYKDESRMFLQNFIVCLPHWMAPHSRRQCLNYLHSNRLSLHVELVARNTQNLVAAHYF